MQLFSFGLFFQISLKIIKILFSIFKKKQTATTTLEYFIHKFVLFYKCLTLYYKTQLFVVLGMHVIREWQPHQNLRWQLKSRETGHTVKEITQQNQPEKNKTNKNQTNHNTNGKRVRLALFVSVYTTRKTIYDTHRMLLIFFLGTPTRKVLKNVL